MIVAGGGTGGHLFPGVAIAEAFIMRDRGNEVLFVGTGRPLEKTILEKYGFPYRTITVEGIKGRGLKRILMALAKIPISMIQSMKILKEYGPQFVLGVGGYAAGPLVLTASLSGYPTAVAEQNALPGVTNRILSRFVNRVFASFPDNQGVFPKKKVIVTGNPVRADLLDEARQAKKSLGQKFTVFIFGGSQGAHIINHTMVQALDFLEDLKDKIQFIHQTGEVDYPFVAEMYVKKGFVADVRVFIVEMAQFYGMADLLVCRAGATTVAEVTALGKAAIFIPFAHAVGDHQTFNARALVEAGAAEMIQEGDLSPKTLADTIRRLYFDRDALTRMEKRARQLGKPQAAEEIVDAIYALIEEKDRR
ncbi:MAG: undecaprenyldiphospho-muramoylpentapeptide beta-N-acetylglucosaminyltransferase [Syntrophales bacterium]|nr:undecaprenyldiphospho-muramoylpentapeptide beta-N-acetylglucosaminyltransferase [Syntrophales bacterium]